jgi:hypothetical protein
MSDQKRYEIAVYEVDASGRRVIPPVLTREVSADDPYCAITSAAEEITEEENS